MLKTALVESGGGMAACYIAGVTYALAKEFPHFRPDIAIAGSGSTGTLSYFVSNQPESIKNIWLKLLSTKKFVNPFRFWRVMDIDYLIDEVFKKQDVLNVANLYSSSTEYIISTTNHRTGVLEHFSNKRRDNVFEAMRASMAMPLAFNKYVKISHKEFCDTDVSACVKLNIGEAMKLGANKILVVNVSELYRSRLTDFFYNLWLKRQTRSFLKHYNKEKKLEIHISSDIKIFQLQPKTPLKIGTLDNSSGTLQKIFEQGYTETVNNLKLREFLNVV